MKRILLLQLLFWVYASHAQQSPCSAEPVYRQLDFWVGEWEVFATNGSKAGDSKISLILDSCIILEEWISVQPGKGLRYAGKSFNSYNASSKQWQQTWVDNAGGSNEYLVGKFDNKTMSFRTTPFKFSKDSMAIRQLQFFDLGTEKVRQLGQISKDNGSTWVIEYDLEYRRRK